MHPHARELMIDFILLMACANSVFATFALCRYLGWG